MAAVLKVNLIRFTFCAILLGGAAALVNFWPTAGLSGRFAVRILALGFMLQPFLALLGPSAGTNDTQKAKVVLAAWLLFLLEIGSVITFITAQNLVLIMAAAFAVSGVSVAALGVYGWLFNRNCFDLVPVRKQADARVTV